MGFKARANRANHAPLTGGAAPPFGPILDRAAARKGGAAALEELLQKPRTAAQLARTGDDRYLSEMARSIFRAGFVWKIVDAKWPGFEEAFGAFDVGRVAHMDDGDLDELAADSRIIRNRPKIAAVRDNARFVWSVANEHGGFGRWLARWPVDDIVGLWHELAASGSRLGGFTGPLFLRMVGVDTFLMSPDVVRALVRARVIDKAPTSKKAQLAVQAAFNAWRAETGRSHTELSRILAYSVD